MPQPVDYAALAEQARQSAAPATVDYDALAAQARGERPPDFRVTNAPPSPSLWERANTPLIPHIATAAHAIADYLDAPKLDRSETETAIRGFLAGATTGAGDLLGSFTSPIGLALTAAGVGPESRLVKTVPGFKAVFDLPAVRTLQRVVRASGGAAFAGHGAERVVSAPTWTEKAQGIGEMAAGGLGIAPELGAARAAYIAARRTREGAEAAHAFALAVPPSKAAPYEAADVHAAMPWLDVEHATTPIRSIEGLRDAADQAVSRIEQHVQQAIAANPQDVIRNQPLDAVRDALRRFTRSDAMPQGLREIEPFHLDEPLTVQRADQIRRDLNAENQATLKKNHYDQATARASDPAFVARETAARALRDGIYQQLEARGIPDVRMLRQHEGALLTIRNAAERQIYSGEKTVDQSAPVSMSRRLGAIGVRSLPGLPAIIADPVARVIQPGALTRDALVARAFALRQPAATPTLPTIPAGPAIRGLLGPGPTITPVPVDASYVRGVPADLAQRPVRGLIGPAPIVTPPPADVSGGGSVPAKKALPVRDPRTGRWKTVWLSEAEYDAALNAMKRK